MAFYRLPRRRLVVVAGLGAQVAVRRGGGAGAGGRLARQLDEAGHGVRFATLFQNVREPQTGSDRSSFAQNNKRVHHSNAATVHPSSMKNSDTRVRLFVDVLVELENRPP